MKKLFIATLVATSISPLLAYKPSSGPESAGRNTDNGSDNNVIKRDQNNQLSTHGQAIPIIAPTSKTINFQGKKYSLKDNNLGGQFEAYLVTAPSSSQAAIEYRTQLQQILDYLAPNKTNGPQLKSAYELLSKAAKYPGDENLCKSITNAIYLAQLTRNNIGSKQEYIARLKKEQELLVHNMSVIESKLEVQGCKDRKKAKKPDRNNNQPPTTLGATEYLVMQKRLVEITALVKKIEVEGAIDLTQSKIQYQAMMVQLFIQRRFEHVIILGRFYNLIYKDSDTKIRLKKGSDTEKFFSAGIGVNPTVARLDAAANEAIRKIDNLVSAFNSNIKSERIHTASERLVQAFAIGQFIPSAQVVTRKDKTKIQQYIQDTNDLAKILEAKDLALGEEINHKLKKQVNDYNASRITAYIAAKKT